MTETGSHLTDVSLPGPVYFVGARYSHHARHSGYEGFTRYVGHHLPPLVRFRYLKFDRFPELGWKIDVFLAQVFKRKYYALGLLITELAAAIHMIWHRGAIYHVLYGDTDICLLGLAGHLTGNHVVATFHEPPEVLEDIVDRRLAESIPSVLLVADSQRPFFERLIHPERIFTVPHGADTTFFCPGQRSSEPTFITVGGHLRDFTTLRQAIDIIHSRRPDIRFVAVGAVGEKGKPPFQHPRVELLNGISDEELRARYQSSWAGVFCFDHVTANNAILEAMACGTPVVVTDTGGVREYVGDSGCASLVPTGDPNAVAEAILQIAAQAPGEAVVMRAVARERALLFDYSRIAELQSAVYARILPGKYGPSGASR